MPMPKWVRTTQASFAANIGTGLDAFGVFAAFYSPNIGGYQDPNVIDGYTYNPGDGNWYQTPPAPDLGQFAWENPASSGTNEKLASLREFRLIHNQLEGLNPGEGSDDQGIWGYIFDYAWEKFKSAIGAILPRDPLTIDLDSDGLETIPLSSGVMFDHDGDGVATGTGWVGPDDGFLVWDRNQNGQIDSGGELFGDSTLKQNGQLAVDGFDALTDLDANQDGRVDALDLHFGHLRVWRDINTNGILDGGELLTLESLGITGFSTAKTENYQILPDGNRIADLGTYFRQDGSSATMGDVGEMADIDLSEDTFTSQFAEQIPLTPLAQALPEMNGAGLVRSMRQAASLQTEAGATFAAKLVTYSALGSRDAQVAALDELLEKWAATSTLSTVIGAARSGTQSDAQNNAARYRFSFGSAPVDLATPINAGEVRVVTVDGQLVTVHGLVDGDRWGYTDRAMASLRRLATLEAFMGRSFVDLDPAANHGGADFTLHSTSVVGEVTERTYSVSFNLAQIELMQLSYEDLRVSVYEGIVLPTRLYPYLQGVTGTLTEGGLSADYTGLVTHYTGVKQVDLLRALTDLVELVRYAGEELAALGWAPLAFLRAELEANQSNLAVQAMMSELGVRFFSGGSPPTGYQEIVFGGGNAETLRGGDGADVIDGGSNGDWIYGEGGPDVLEGGSGNDTLLGGSGSDVYLFGYGSGRDTIFNQDSDPLHGDQPDVIVMGVGLDAQDILARRMGDDLVLSVVGVTDSLRVFSYFSDDALTAHAVEWVRFTNGWAWSIEDTKLEAIKATVGADILIGYAGDDTLGGGDGGDVLYGRAGADVLDGGPGADILLGEEGSDTLRGGPGDDSVDGGPGSDTYWLHRGDGGDTLNAVDLTASKVDTLRFGAAIDPLDVRLRREWSVTSQLDDLYFEIVSGAQPTGDHFRVVSPFESEESSRMVDRVVFDGGAIWTLSDIRARLVTSTSGPDRFRGFAGADMLDGGPGADEIAGASGDDIVRGGDGTDVLYGENGNDLLQGDPGDDRLIGGDGNDVYLYVPGDGSDSITDAPATGTSSVADTLRFGGGILPSDITLHRTDDFIGANADLTVVVRGSATAQIFVPGFFGSSNEIEFIEFLEGPGGTVGTRWDRASMDGRLIAGDANVMTGSPGSDHFVVDNERDIISEQPGGGTDSVESRVSYILPANVEQLTLTGVLNARVTGNDSANTLRGNINNNRLDGGRGSDTMIGGPGDDLYIDNDPFESLNYQPDSIIELENEGYDTIDARTYNYQLPDHVERLVLQATSTWYGYQGTELGWAAIPRWARGNSLDNVLDASAATLANEVRFDGGGGADQYIGHTGKDTYVIDAGDAILSTGDVGTPVDAVESFVSFTLGEELQSLKLLGNAPITGTGNGFGNFLAGSANPAANVLTGGAGDDIYVLGAGDSAVEEAGGGESDRVRITYRAGPSTFDPVVIDARTFANVEWIELTNAAGITRLVGDDRANSFVGNYLDAFTHVYGTEMLGGAGDDFLVGSFGVDLLDGGPGADRMVSGGRNDTYIVDDPGDVVVEQATYWNPDTQSTVLGGADTIRSSVSYTLPAEVEILVLTGSESATAAGNDAANTLDGSQNNAADLLVGGAGNDRYYVAAGDVILEAPDGGDDTVYSFVSIAEAPENVEEIRLAGTGNLDATGNSQDNTIFGNEGNNVIHGGVGNDWLSTSNGPSGEDILDGEAGDDTYAILYYSGGQTTIASADDTPGKLDIVLFGASSTELGFYRESDDLVFTQVRLSGSQLPHWTVIRDYFAAVNPTRIERFDFGDSVQLTAADIAARIVEGTPGPDTIIGTAVGESIAGLDGNDTLRGGDGSDLIAGGAGDDVLDGELGDDLLLGGAGNDTYLYSDDGFDRIVEAPNEGEDTIQTPWGYWLPENVENLTLTGTSPADGTGNGLANRIIGNTVANVLYGYDGDDWLEGGGGTDWLEGGVGNDTYTVDGTSDTVVEYPGEGTDSVRSSVTLALGANLENLTLIGTGAINATGNGLDNVLVGNGGANTLNGGAGADTMRGGPGNDTYVVDNAGDSIVENASEGTDLVQASVSFTLGANLENLTLTGSGAINATGNAANNTLTGNSGVNIIDGGAGADAMNGGSGNDTYIVDNAGDTVTESSSSGGSDTVLSSVTFTLGSNVEHLTLTGTAAINGTGNSLSNTIIGNPASNTLSGESGADSLRGGAGDDTYIVDNAGDTVVENPSEGTDLVRSSVTYMLAANVENLTLTGSSAINGTGNALNNTLTGNNANNTLTGGDGADWLDGGSGSDAMAGGLGDDAYVVAQTGDAVTENASAGTDTVRASITYTLGANVENLVLTGMTAINGTGNTLNNVLTGNSSNNTLTGNGGGDWLDGLAGSDTMVGGAGNDTYVVTEAGDVVTESSGQGTDTVRANVTYTLGANVENIILTGTAAINGTGNTLNNVMTGNAASNNLNGNAGADTLDGGAGTDTLTGGTGNDTYLLGRGHGADTVVENDATAGNIDVAKFLAGVAHDQVWLLRSGNNLEASILGTADRFIVQDWYLDSRYHVEQFKTTDGDRALLEANVQNLVDAMAGFAPPAMGQTTLPPDYQTALASVIAANWQ